MVIGTVLVTASRCRPCTEVWSAATTERAKRRALGLTDLRKAPRGLGKR